MQRAQAQPSRARVDRSFRAWGVSGIGCSIVVALALAAGLGLSLLVQAIVAAASVVAFLALALAEKRRTGRESLTFYHHALAILAVAAGVAEAAGAPVLGHLDATALGLLAADALGRVGCLRVGCCHGRVARRGVRYGEAHVQAGFPRYLAGVPLLPVQALEAFGAATIAVAGAVWVADPGRPGFALGFAVCAYAVMRIGLEELRGDAARRYAGGLSEPQWTSLGVIVAAGVATPFGGGATVAAALALLELGAIAVLRRRRRGVFDPRHVREVAALAVGLSQDEERGPGPIPVWVTSDGLRLSSGRVGTVRHLTLSHERAPLAPDEATRLGDLIGTASRAAPLDLVYGPAGTYHVLLPATTTARPGGDRGRPAAAPELDGGGDPGRPAAAPELDGGGDRGRPAAARRGEA
jgi:hypothetical protein